MSGISLELSDVIIIENLQPVQSDAQSSENNKNKKETFLIEYVDSKKIKAINIETFEKIILLIDHITHQFTNYTASRITVVHQHPEKGFTRQNNLLKSTWINIVFLNPDTNVEESFVGKITKHVNDEIKIVTYPDKQTIFIDFEYKGLPEDIPIVSIKIIDDIIPRKKKSKINVTDKINIDTQEKKTSISLDNADLKGSLSNDVENVNNNVSDDNNMGDVILEQDHGISLDNADLKGSLSNVVENVNNVEQDNYVQDDNEPNVNSEYDIVIGDELYDSITEFVEVDLSKNIYGIDSQKNDLLDSMLIQIPIEKRTEKNKLHVSTMVDRFVQLRNQYSVFDSRHNITDVKTVNRIGNPMLSYFTKLDKTLYWIVPVTQTKSHLSTSTYMPDEDFVDVFETDTYLQSINAEIDMYLSNTSGFNKYKMLYKNLHNIQIPYSPISNPTGFLFDIAVHAEMYALNNVLSDFTTFTYSGQDKFMGKIHSTGLSMLWVNNLRASNIIADKIVLSEPDILSVTSFLTLPKSVVSFSRINLPGTSIMDRANLNANYFSYWKALNAKTIVTDSIVRLNPEFDDADANPLSSLDKPTSDNFKSIVNHILTESETSALTKKEQYTKMVSQIVPSIPEIVTMLKTTKLGSNLSTVDIIRAFEPFLIYSENVTFQNGQHITELIRKKMLSLSHTRKKRTIMFNNLKNDANNINNDDTTKYSHLLMNALPGKLSEMQSIYSDIFKAKTSSEILNQMIMTDGTNGYTTLMLMQNESLLFPTNLVDYIDREKKTLSEKFESFQKENADCIAGSSSNSSNNLVTSTSAIHQPSTQLVKMYNDIQSMDEDNGTKAVVDPEYDATHYDKRDIYLTTAKTRPDSPDFEELKSELLSKNTNLSEMDAIELANEGLLKYKLIKILMLENKMTKRDAHILATSLIEGERIVQEGDVAGVLNSNGEITYYTRSNNMWVLMNSPPLFGGNTGSINSSGINNSVNSFDVVACNANPTCISAHNTNGNPLDCASTNSLSTELELADIDRLEKNVQLNYQHDKQTLHSTLLLSHTHNVQTGLKRQKLTHLLEYKNNQHKYNLGMEHKMTPSREMSPYMPLLNTILSQQNVGKKQYDIVRFVNQFTRPYSLNHVTELQTVVPESPHWLYCTKSDLVLLPVFKYNLATAYMIGQEQYATAIRTLINVDGVLGDNGGSWVHKYTGVEIQAIDFDTNEGFNEAGFKITTKAVIDTEDDGIEKIPPTVLMPVTPIIRVINAITNELTGQMDIEFTQIQKQFIYRTCTRAVEHNMKSLNGKDAYTARLAKSGKKGPSYELVQNQQLIYNTLGAVFIAIQTAVPPIVTQKTVRKCVRSFSGFPLDDITDVSGLEYIACVAKKLRTSIEPWNAMHKQLVDIVAKLKKTILSTNNVTQISLLEIPEVIDKLSAKRVFNETADSIYVDAVAHTTDSTNESILKPAQLFLPPLHAVDIGFVNSITPQFREKLLSNIKRGSVDQVNNILTIQSKIVQHALLIQEKLEKIVNNENKKDLLVKKLNGDLYLQNACCLSDSDFTTTLQHFYKEDPTILSDNEWVKTLSNILSNIHSLTHAPILISQEDTRKTFGLRNFPLSQNTINTGFIKLCKMGTVQQLKNRHIRSYCESITIPDSLTGSFGTYNKTVDEVLDELNRNNIKYTPKQFSELLKLVHANNLLSIETSQFNDTEPQYKMLKLVHKLKSENISGAYSEKELYDLLGHVLESDKGDTNNAETNLNEYLARQICDSTRVLTGFSTENRGNISKTNMKKFIKAITDMFSMNFDEDEQYFNRTIEFYKLHVIRLLKIIPSTVDMSHTIPHISAEHWTYPSSGSFLENISTDVSMFANFYNSDTMGPIILGLSSYGAPLFELAKQTKLSLFSQHTGKMLYKYYLIKGLLISTRIATDENILVRTETVRFIQEFTKTIETHHKITNISHKTLIDKVFKRKDTEKHAMIRRNKQIPIEYANVAREISRFTVEVHDKYQLDFEDEDGVVRPNASESDNNFGEEDSDTYGADDMQCTEEECNITDEYGLFEYDN
jgi:hypothetical protein